MARDRTDDAIVDAFADVRTAIKLLALDARGGNVTARSAMVLCPWHGERTPSCHLSVSADELVAHCHGCKAGGDVFALAAAVFGLTMPRDMRAAKVRLAELVGVAVERGGPASPPSPRPVLPPPRPYPPRDEVLRLWSASLLVGDDKPAAAWARSRGLNVAALEDGDLCRVIPKGATLPRWASYQGRTWAETGHRLIVRTFDATGQFRGVRAARVVDGDTPKRLPPAGYRAGGLILADALGRLALEGADRAAWPRRLRVVVVEGEPDFLTWASRYSDADEDAPAVLGVLSGSWSPELAARIPDGAELVIRTDLDDAGDRYAEEIASPLRGRCEVFESDPDGRAERRRTRPEREAARRAENARPVAS